MDVARFCRDVLGEKKTARQVVVFVWFLLLTISDQTYNNWFRIPSINSSWRVDVKFIWINFFLQASLSASKSEGGSFYLMIFTGKSRCLGVCFSSGMPIRMGVSNLSCSGVRVCIYELIYIYGIYIYMYICIILMVYTYIEYIYIYPLSGQAVPHFGFRFWLGQFV